MCDMFRSMQSIPTWNIFWRPFPHSTPIIILSPKCNYFRYRSLWSFYSILKMTILSLFDIRIWFQLNVWKSKKLVYFLFWCAHLVYKRNREICAMSPLGEVTRTTFTSTSESLQCDKSYSCKQQWKDTRKVISQCLHISISSISIGIQFSLHLLVNH